jgi:hypothetical protein
MEGRAGEAGAGRSVNGCQAGDVGGVTGRQRACLTLGTLKAPAGSAGSSALPILELQCATHRAWRCGVTLDTAEAVGLGLVVQWGSAAKGDGAM